MSSDLSLPNYIELFGDLNFSTADESRSVYSPAAYLADLLELLDDHFDAPPLRQRRPNLGDIALNAENTYDKVPYLDIVNEVLAEHLEDDDALATKTVPLDLPFSQSSARFAAYLDELKVAPADFYRQFAQQADPTVTAREYLGLSEAEVALVTTESGPGGLPVVPDVAGFLRATTLTGAELRELLLQNLAPGERAAASGFFIHQGGGPVTLDATEQRLIWDDDGVPPADWFDRVGRFVRLVRKTGLSIADLDLVLRTCCANRIDEAALRTVAAIVSLHRLFDLPVDVVCSLAAPINLVGRGEDVDDPQGLFDQVFNVPFQRTDATVVTVPGRTSAKDDEKVLGCSGDILALANKDYRLRLSRALGITEADIVVAVTRYRRRPAGSTPELGPFDRGDIGLPELSLLHRIGRLASALGTTVEELFDVLDALERDPSIPAAPTFAHHIDTGPHGSDCYRMLDAVDVGSSLWLIQVLIGVVRWMQGHSVNGKELLQILGGPSVEADPKECAATLAELRQPFEGVLLAPEVFESSRFDERSAEVIHDALSLRPDGVVSAVDERLLRLDPAVLEGAAYQALTELGRITEEDFLDLGLNERLNAKVFTSLVLTGCLGSDGILVEAELPAEDLQLNHDFDAYRQPLLDRLVEASSEESPALFPSDLAAMVELTAFTDDQRAELYDNLIFNGYLDHDGSLLNPDWFTAAEYVEKFTANADVAELAPAVLELFHERVRDFSDAKIGIEPAIFEPLGLTDARVADLLESLRFNGYLDERDRYRDKVTLAGLPLADFDIALEFYPHRKAVLEAMQAQLQATKAEVFTFGPDDFDELTDEAVAQRITSVLDGTYLTGERVNEDLRKLLVESDSDGDLPLGSFFTAAERATVFHRIAVILRAQQPYQLDLTAITDLGFEPGERDDLVDALIERGDLTGELIVPLERLAHFRNVGNALAFTLPGLDDYAKDVFFLLNAAANELTDAITEIVGALTDLAQAQVGALATGLQAAFGVPAGTGEAICRGVVGNISDTLDVLVAPVLAAADDLQADGVEPVGITVPTGSRFRLAYRRIRAFALLAAKLAMTDSEVEVAFHDQDLAGSFPEPISLPPGVDSFDALLEDSDGTVYLFAGTSYWVYQPLSYELERTQPRALTELSPRFAGLASVDATFIDAAGTAWLVGRTSEGASRAFVRESGDQHWAPKDQVWGKIKNNFADPAAIDTAFTDDEGKTYLFCGDQYVRYSSSDYTRVDEGYPRTLGEWREDEGPRVQLTTTFRFALDASFEGKDGKVHLFKGSNCVTVDGEEITERPIAEAWGRVRNIVTETGRVDAAYADGSSVYLFAGNQVVRYDDSIEYPGARVADGSPTRIEAHFGNVPAGFESGLDAALVDGNGVTHLFKDGKTVALTEQDRTVIPAGERWGKLGPMLPSGAVDAGFVGLDGRTYLFSGEQYLRYTGADYAKVDLGYPRAITKDWGGLRRVDASFVLDGKTYLFGPAAQLFELGLDHEADLAAGRLSRKLRQRFAEHGLEFLPDTVVDGQSPQWGLTTSTGVAIVVRREQKRITVTVDPASETRFYVSYSSRDYTKPDPGYPKPLADNWWNLPAGLIQGDADFSTIDSVFTGRDNRTYLFSGGQFVVFDNKNRWWSQPKALREHWDSIPFERVDAAFVGTDEKTYLFSGGQYLRYSTTDYTAVDDRYPAPVEPFWCNVTNAIARTGKVDATLVLTAAEPGAEDAEQTYTYLFSGSQYVRYTGHDHTTVDPGYPKPLASLDTEPRLGKLGVVLDRVDAAFADRRTVYLFSADTCHAVSDRQYRKYDQLAGPEVGCAFVEDGSVLVESAGEWQHWSALEAPAIARTPARPRALRTAPAEFRTGLDAVLSGTDGNTYLFKGGTCFNTQLNRTYPIAEEWGRPRTNVYHDSRVDAAFVGLDDKTYVFSGDQFVVYAGTGYLDAQIDGGPRPVAPSWSGLDNVALSYVQDNRTYLFERPAADGTIRYVSYTGADYTRPDGGGPQLTHAGFWSIPDRYRPDGFTIPDAVIVEGENLLLVTGEECLQYARETQSWSYPRPLRRIWPALAAALTDDDRIEAAFSGRDGATYFFLEEEFIRLEQGTAAARQQISAVWGRTDNDFVSSVGADVAAGSGKVDASVVFRGQTFLFAGDQFVRYSGPDYRYVDDGYPRKIVGNLRKEAAFAGLPTAFEDAVGQRIDTGVPSVIDAVVAGERTACLFMGGDCHAVSAEPVATRGLEEVGRTRNPIADRGKVDAALVVDDYTFLFSGDSYVRYTGADYTTVDHGYPRTLESGLPAELGVASLPEPFTDRIDAAFRGPDGQVVLFSGKVFLRLDGPDLAPEPIAGIWGAVRNDFGTDSSNALDAAFVAPSGELYAFRGGQYVRYGAGPLGKDDLVAEGFPRTIKDDWGDLPPAFEESITGAFTFQGRTYLSRDESCVRYSTDDFHRPDRTYPQLFRQRWGSAGDYRLSDLHPISAFVDLIRAHPGSGLAEFLHTGVDDPYGYLAELFGWDADEVRWTRRIGGFLPTEQAQDRLEIEFMLKLVELFSMAEKFGIGPSKLFTEIWSRVHGASEPDLGAAADLLAQLLARKYGEKEWPAVSDRLRDALNAKTRSALVSAVTSRSTEPILATSADLFEHLLIDVDMGGEARTSRVREAVAATQLYLHRYLLNLERPVTEPGQEDEVRKDLKTWWRWMRSYRLWEANRKVFLYPENYLRPELRTSKTSAFKALEDELLQTEVTEESVQKAYKRYLDEYTEVSRLLIAGGYVYAEDKADDARRLVLFGQTRTEPRRYYYREAEFQGGGKLSTTWGPWRKVGVQINTGVADPADAGRVYPIHAFGRIFVFWPVVEPVPPKADAKTTVKQEKKDDNTSEVSSETTEYRVNVLYSFRDLAGEWVPAQTLAIGEGVPYRIDKPPTLNVEYKAALGQEWLSIAWTYRLHAQTEGRKDKEAFSDCTLTKDLSAGKPWTSYADAPPLTDAEDPDGVQADLVSILDGADSNETKLAKLVRFNSAVPDDGKWFGIDHRGGSFLFRSPAASIDSAPKPLAMKGNKEQPKLPRLDRVDAAVELPSGTRFFFSGAEVHIPSKTGISVRKEPIAKRFGMSTVDSAWMHDRLLYLTSGNQLHRYTVGDKDAIASQPDAGYPVELKSTIETAFVRDDTLYLFASGRFARADAARDPQPETLDWRSVSEGWRGLPAAFIAKIDAVLDGGSDLYFFNDDKYVRYPKSAEPALPYELANLPYEVVRLTSSTAARLNQRLLAGGVDALLALDTQQDDELPRFRVDSADLSTIQVHRDKVEKSRLPASTHLDFQSANGIYYWEIFFHAPLLIAQTLNGAQRFEEAKRWYEYVFDPTEPAEFWRFLPFISRDIDSLADSCIGDTEILKRATEDESAALRGYQFDLSAFLANVEHLVGDLRLLAPAYRYGTPLTGKQLAVLRDLGVAEPDENLRQIAPYLAGIVGPDAAAALEALQEKVGIIAGLQRDYQLMADSRSLEKAYQEDPSDPHRIAELRPVAYRRAVVMAYIDNLLDWGDMLFRQYTPESVDEARMLYVLAYDLLGIQPQTIGTRLPTAERTFTKLDEESPDELDLVSAITMDGTLTEGAGTVHKSVASRYFSIPGNSTFAEYWDRVVDRLRKIRASQNILGISQPLPLFEPPIDPMALVRGAAAGQLDAAGQGATGPVPHYRFSFLLRQAQELVDKATRLGSDLLSVLERRDGEELSQLQNRQEGTILSMTQAIKDAQVQAATETVQELKTSLKSASKRVDYYDGLLLDPVLALELLQMTSMSGAAAAHVAATVFKVGSAATHGIPQAYIGPFNVGVEMGGEQLAEALGKIAEVFESGGEGLSILGELYGVMAGFIRSRQEWSFQKATAECDVEQIGHQIAGAEQQLAVAQREREILAKEIAHNESVAMFMTSKFANADLYQWMSGRLGELYFQTYTMAHDMAKAAERAYQFERGEDQVSYIQPGTWDSKRKGLLAGESLSLDLDRLGKAALDNDARGLEVTKRISLLDLDPLALLRLRADGRCELALTESLFDYDFPGHYRRQLRTVTVSFVDAEGQAVELNAMLTQLGHKTVLEPNPKVVKFLIEPKGEQPAGLRTDWRASQQIALSHVDDRTDNNGLFELRYDDDRYLPFEGTGAVSTWRLEINGLCPPHLRDVVLTVKYSAEWGGEVFANAVRGMLKPYPAARFVDVAKDFAPQWEEFISNGGTELRLPITPDLLPNIKGRQVNAIYPKYELTNGGSARFTVNGDARLTLTDGKLLPTPGLSVGNGDSAWTLQLDGDKQALTNLGLVLSYQAGVR